MASLVPIAPRFFAVRYDGTNRAQILGLLNSDSITNIVEASGVLSFTAYGYLNYSVNQGNYMTFMADGNTPYASVQNGEGGGLTTAELNLGFYALTPGVLPS